MKNRIDGWLAHLERSLQGLQRLLRKRGQFRRVYLHGMLLVLLIAAAVFIAGLWLHRRPPWTMATERLGSYLVSRSAELTENSQRLSRDLAMVQDLMGIEMTIFSPNGKEVASSHQQSSLAPLPPAVVAHLAASGRPWHIGPAKLAVPVISNGHLLAYVVIRPPLLPHLARASLVLAIVLMVVALGSIPLARAITSPLEQLTRAAEQLGSGDLSVRTGIQRGDEVGDLARAFDQMANCIERLIRSEKELLANVSHELRTPLARIRVALELAAEGDAAQAQRHLLEIRTDLAELEQLVEDVLVTSRLDLALAKSEPSISPVRRVSVDGGQLLEEVVARFQASHPEQPVELSVGGKLPKLSGDAVLLRRAIANLLDNARKYSDGQRPIELIGRLAEGQLEILVRDHGAGIHPDDLPNLFTPFFRGDRSRARETGGVGLGLALVRRVVEAHQGEVSVESQLNQGTVVRIRLPITSSLEGLAES